MNGTRYAWPAIVLTVALAAVQDSASSADPARGPAVRAESVEADGLQPPPAPEPPPLPEPLTRPEPVPPGGNVGQAAPRAALNLADFEGMALAENPALAAAAGRLEATRGRWIQAGLYPNTEIGYFSEEMGNLDQAGKQGMFVNQRFVTGGKLRLDRAVAAQEVEAARYEYESACWRVLNDVRIRFHELLIAQQRVTLTEKLADLGEESAAASRKLLTGQLISRTDLLQAEIEAESAHILHDNALGDYQEAWRRLSAVAGVPNLAATSVAGDPGADLPEYSYEQCLGKLLGESPELAAAGARVERARLAISRARRERIPNVDLMVGVAHANVSSDDAAMVRVGFPLPLLDRNQGNIHRAEGELAEACGLLKKAELALQDRLAVAYRRYANARQQAERYTHRILPRARESLKWVQEGYAQGQVDYLTLLISQRTYFRANLDYLDSLRELRTAGVVLDGLLLTGSLQPTGG